MSTTAGADTLSFLQGQTPRIFGVPPHTPFLKALVAVLITLPSEVLAATTILLPSRRACIALHDTFMNERAGAPMLLPRMRAVGDADADVEIIKSITEVTDPLEPIGAVQRVLLLSRLIRAERDVTDEQSVRLAKELARFLDEIQTEEVSLDQLQNVVPRELSEHWQRILEFLRILTDHWPNALAQAGLVDPIIWRNQRIRIEIEQLAWRPSQTPIIAAGITGSVPVVAELMAAVARTEQGCVVLPGFDPSMGTEGWEQRSSTHPYAGIKLLLDKLGVDAKDIQLWPGASLPEECLLRTNFMINVFRDSFAGMAEATDNSARLAASSGLSVEESPDLATEATSIALRLRESHEHKDKTAVLVTSDRNLARRVAVELRRWNIEIDDSAGVPLDQSPPGSLLLLTARAVITSSDPVALLAALKHPLARARRTLPEFRRLVRRLELKLLRGPRVQGGLLSLASALESHTAAREDSADHELLELVSALAEAASPFAELTRSPTVALEDLLRAHLSFLEALVRDVDGSPAEFWSHEAGETLARFLDELLPTSGSAGNIDPQGYPAILAVLMADQAVRPQRRVEARLSILGQYESRLLQADLVIIGGLNEGIWPRSPSPNPWLNRTMRQALGLPDDRLKISAAALDFLCLTTMPEVLLSRSQKDYNGAPNSPSRWLARINAVLTADGVIAAVHSADQYAHWADQLDQPDSPFPRPCPAPSPKPSREARPLELSVTDVENLIRDPYSVYAKRILGLSPLDPLDADPGMAERGLIIHGVLEQFVRTYPTDLPPAPLDDLLSMGRSAFATLAHRPQVQALWWPRFESIAKWFVDLERDRRRHVEMVHAEVQGELTLDVERRIYRIRARADRIEVDHSGSFNILDYKTGAVPTAALVRDGISPQLPIEGAIMQAEGFAIKSGGNLGELLHVGLGGGEKGGMVQDPTLKNNKSVVETDDLSRQARAWLEDLIRFFDAPVTPYFAVPYPDIAPRYNPYEHLERVFEWRGAHG
ncbi:MAG: double-strand break repair protein AddB [Pseudomonadota bacterium]